MSDIKSHGRKKTDAQDVKIEPVFTTMICVDPDPATLYAFNWALVYSVASRDNVVIVTHQANTEKRPAAFKLLADYSKIASNAGLTNFSTKLLTQDTVAKGIKLFARQLNPSLIIMGTRGLNAVKRTFLGSVSDYTVHHSRCPVLVIHKEKFDKGGKTQVKSLNNPPNMVIAVNDSVESRRNLMWAVENALPSTVNLTMLYIQDAGPTDPMFMEEFKVSTAILDNLISHVKPHIRKQIKKQVGYGDRGDFITQFCKKSNADLLMIATRGMGAVGRQLMGSVSDYCLHNLTCPILVYKDYNTNTGAKRREDAARDRYRISDQAMTDKDGFSIME